MADPLELVEIPIDQAAVAFVAHHEVIPGRHCARTARLIVGTILMKRESLDVYTAFRMRPAARYGAASYPCAAGCHP
jgi:hypothetical protein